MDRKEYIRNYQREWIANRRKEFFQDKVCHHCGSIENLELHHLDPSLKIANSIWSWKEERRIAEIAKCIVLCESCHKVETKKQVEVEHSHGTKQRYNHGCRCRECKDAWVVRWRKYRQELREQFGPDFRKHSITDLRTK